MNITINSKLILQSIKDVFLLDKIKKKLTLDNPQYQNAMKYNGYVRNIPENLFFYNDFENVLSMPRGFAYQLWHFLKNNGIKPNLSDRRRVLAEIPFSFHGDLRTYQVGAVQNVLKRDFGLLVAPTGSGKTAMALWLIAERKHQL